MDSFSMESVKFNAVDVESQEMDRSNSLASNLSAFRSGSTYGGVAKSFSSHMEGHGANLAYAQAV